MKTLLIKTTLIAAISLFISSVPAMPHSNKIAQALNHKERPQQDKQRDEARKPAEIMALVDIHPNMNIVDFIAGRGYYTELFARVLNNSGQLYSVKAKLENRDLRAFNNIHVLPELDLSTITSPVDRIFTALNYHDLINKQALDRQQLLKSFYRKLAPDGYLIVIDHNAAPGSGASHTKKLHRVENTFVLNEILAAGFILDSSLNILANLNDNFDLDVWQDSTKGKTDRFVYRFKKNSSINH